MHTEGAAADPGVEPQSARMSSKPLEPSASNEIKSVSGGSAIAATAAAFEQIDAVLTPIIGNRGVEALFQRSVALTSLSHPWLAHACETDASRTGYVAIEVALARQNRAEAAAACTALLRTFTELLTGLIGYRLTERLLRPIEAARLQIPGIQETNR